MCVFQWPSVLWRCWLGGRKGIRPVKTEWWGAGVVICLERGADLHTAQLMPLPLTTLSLASVNFRLVLPFWYRLTRIVPEKGPLNGCVCIFQWTISELLCYFQGDWMCQVRPQRDPVRRYVPQYFTRGNQDCNYSGRSDLVFRKWFIWKVSHPAKKVLLLWHHSAVLCIYSIRTKQSYPSYTTNCIGSTFPTGFSSS